MPPATYTGGMPLQEKAEGLAGGGAFIPARLPYAGPEMGASPEDSGVLSLPTYSPSHVTASDSRLRGRESIELVLATVGGASGNDNKPEQHIALAPVDRPATGSADSVAAEGSSGDTSQSGGPDQEVFAREVYSIIKNRLAVERDRMGCA